MAVVWNEVIGYDQQPIQLSRLFMRFKGCNAEFPSPWLTQMYHDEKPEAEVWTLRNPQPLSGKLQR